ncbi:uncharacterized protein LOC142975453 isoform X3 [Anticarsia gemmatalis]|uniref:uncharacterized protein LOC142975453 isoform X3 n=1 Tax=Anticarsia gemmatalis TaxID=129554 RepID=UPI003F7632C0
MTEGVRIAMRRRDRAFAKFRRDRCDDNWVQFKVARNRCNQMKPAVRWRRILLYDPIQCARYLYCELGAQPPNNEVRQGFIYMLTLEPDEENASAHGVFKEAYDHGRLYPKQCRKKYPMCVFNEKLLFDLIYYLLRHPQM